MNPHRRNLLRGSLALAYSVVLPFLMTTTALAGDFHVRHGVAIKGFDPVAYFVDNKPVKGSPAHQAEYRSPKRAPHT